MKSKRRITTRQRIPHSFVLGSFLVTILSGCLTSVSTPTGPPPSSNSADSQPLRPAPDLSAVVPITYEDLDLPMEPDSVFQDWMLTQRVRDLDGRRVRISGFMFAGSVFTLHNVKNFILLREKECPFGNGGQAHHAVDVALDRGIDFSTAVLTVEGVLRVKPFTGENGKTWAVYQLEGTSVD